MPEPKPEAVKPAQELEKAVSAIIRTALGLPREENKLDGLDPVTAARVDDQKTDTELKRRYANWFIGILAVQLLAMNVVFVCVGLGILQYKEPLHLNLFMGGTLLEVFGVVLVITRYLFSKKT